MKWLKRRKDRRTDFSQIYIFMMYLKLLLSRMLVSKRSVHCVLAGLPASGKMIFLLSIKKSMDATTYFSQMQQMHREQELSINSEYPQTRIILIDEIEKMSKTKTCFLIC